MTDYRTTGTHQINKWLWSKLKNFEHIAGVRAFDAYGEGKVNVIPFVPSQQIAEFNNIAGGAPFIVYNYTASPDIYTQRDMSAYVIYDNDTERLRAIHLYMIDLLRRLDWTAADINTFLGNSPWNFKWVRVTTASGPDQFVQEGGRQGATISIVSQYTRDQNDEYGNGLRI